MIGFFGGSFDPVHYGHLKNAAALKTNLQLDKLFLMPCAHHVYKNKLSYTKKQRLHMLNLAIEEFDTLSIARNEIDNEKSYTIDSLKKIKKQYQDITCCLIMGMDNFINISTWKDWQQFTKYASIVVIARANYKLNKQLSQLFIETTDINELTNSKIGLLYFFYTKPINISSSEIRHKILNKQKLSGLMPNTIINYINSL